MSTSVPIRWFSGGVGVSHRRLGTYTRYCNYWKRKCIILALIIICHKHSHRKTRLINSLMMAKCDSFRSIC